jgi:hypothetical protein
MRISELVSSLEKFKRGHGDLEVAVMDPAHTNEDEKWITQVLLRGKGRNWDGDPLNDKCYPHEIVSIWVGEEVDL